MASRFYANIPSSIIRNPKLSYGAIGLYAMMKLNTSGRRNKWQNHLNHLSTLKAGKRYKIRQYMKELESFGIVQLMRITDKQGRVIGWDFHIKPESNNQTLDEKSDTAMQDIGNATITTETQNLISPHLEKPDAKYYQEEIKTNKKEYIKQELSLRYMPDIPDDIKTKFYMTINLFKYPYDCMKFRQSLVTYLEKNKQITDTQWEKACLKVKDCREPTSSQYPPLDDFIKAMQVESHPVTDPKPEWDDASVTSDERANEACV